MKKQMKKILVVDPDEQVIQTIQHLLEAEAFEVFTASTMNDTATFLVLETFELIIANPAICKGEGISVVDWLKTHTQSVKIILLDKDGGYSSAKGNILLVDRPPNDYSRLTKCVKTCFAENGFSTVVQNIQLEKYLKVCCENGGSKAILVGKDHQRGIILVENGRIIYAANDEIKGEEAYGRLLQWKDPKFKEIEIKQAPTPNMDLEYGDHLKPGDDESLLPFGDLSCEQKRGEVPALQRGMKSKGTTEGLEGAFSVLDTGTTWARSRQNEAVGVAKREKRKWLVIGFLTVFPLIAVVMYVADITGHKDSVEKPHTEIAQDTAHTEPSLAVALGGNGGTEVAGSNTFTLPSVEVSKPDKPTVMDSSENSETGQMQSDPMYNRGESQADRLSQDLESW